MSFGRRLIGWTFLATILAVVGFACITVPPMLAFVGVIVALGMEMQRRQRKQLKDLADSRRGESLCSFARGFDFRNTDTWVIRAVYEELQEYLDSDCADFPIRPDDRLEVDLGIDGDDLDLDLAKQIAQRTGRSLTRTKGNAYYGKVKTPRDLVRFFVGQEETWPK